MRINRYFKLYQNLRGGDEVETVGVMYTVPFPKHLYDDKGWELATRHPLTCRQKSWYALSDSYSQVRAILWSDGVITAI